MLGSGAVDSDRNMRRAILTMAFGLVLFFIPHQLPDHSRPNQPFLNGIWVDAFNEGFQSGEEVEKLVESIYSAGINALFLQVRRRGDVLFPSVSEPRMTLRRADWDPLPVLQKAVSGMREKIQLHGWLVCGPVWNRKSLDRLPDGHILRTHPDWLMMKKDGSTWGDGEYYLELGLPEVQRHLTQLSGELAESGLVDGIHLDYIRYPGRDWGYHPEVVEEFLKLHPMDHPPNPDDTRWMAFRRQKITDLVASIFCRVKVVNPEIIVSAATITFAPGPEKPSHWLRTSAYAYLFQDWKYWLEAGVIDWAIPMCYFSEVRHAENFRKWVDFLAEWDHASRVAVGLGLYLNSYTDNLSQFEYTLNQEVSGQHFLGAVGYSYANPSATLEDGSVAEIYPTQLYPSGTSMALQERPIPPSVTQPFNSHNSGYVAIHVDGKPEQFYAQSTEIQLFMGKKLLSTLKVNSAGFAWMSGLKSGLYEAVLMHRDPSSGFRELQRSIFSIRSGNVTECHFQPGI